MSHRFLASPLLVLLLVAGCGGDSPVNPDPEPDPVARLIVLEPDRDNTLFEDPTGQLSNGKGSFLFAGVTDPKNNSLTRRALVHFDLQVIPPGTVIDSVEFVLTMDRTIVRDVEVKLHRVLNSWGEGDSDAPFAEGMGTQAEVDDATWLHRRFDQIDWDSPGGDYSFQATATQTVGIDRGTYVWKSSTLTQDVRGWIVNPGINFGWIVIADENAGITAKRFGSREEEAANRPKLRIFFQG